MGAYWQDAELSLQVIKSEGLIYMVLEYGDIDLARLLQRHEATQKEGGSTELDENFIRLYWQQMLQVRIQECLTIGTKMTCYSLPYAPICRRLPVLCICQEHSVPNELLQRRLHCWRCVRLAPTLPSMDKHPGVQALRCICRRCTQSMRPASCTAT